MMAASLKVVKQRGTASDLENRVEKRFGVLSSFFRLAPETPEITERVWGFAEAAYLDNPLPPFLGGG